jgi:YggT family protein
MMKNQLSFLLAACCGIAISEAFVSPSPQVTHVKHNANAGSLSMMMDLSSVTETASAVTSSGLSLAETEAWVKPVATVVDPLLNFMSFAMLCRVVLSWYPNFNINEVPWIFVVWPTQNLLRLVKDVIPPAFGVDITPIFWLAIFTFIHEILVGQQGLFTLKIQYGI